MPRNKARRFLLNLDPVLAAAFYIGFILVAIFTLAVYARYLTKTATDVQNEQNEKIIVAQISTCQRNNEIRLKVGLNTINCQRDIRAITEGLLKRVENRDGN